MITMTCKYCGKEIVFDPKARKWMTIGKKPKWKCKSDNRFPVRAHVPRDEG